MSQENYARLVKLSNKLLNLTSSKKFYNPQLTRNKVFCMVDKNLSLHVLRCGKNSFDDQPSMQTIEYTTIADENQQIVWQALNPTIFFPAFPVLALYEEKVFASVIGLLKNDQTNIDFSRYYAHFWTLNPEENNFLATHPLPLNSALKMAISPSGKISLVSTTWLPQVAIAQSRPLILSSYQNGEFAILANPVLGTDAIGSFPSDITIYITTKNEIHLVYDGFYKSLQENQVKHLFHLKLDTNGKILSVEDLGIAPKFPIISEIITAPNGSLYLLVIYFEEHNRQMLEHKIIKINGEEIESDRAEYYFMDTWLQIHKVWFEEEQIYYFGSDRIPG